jgi:hypothetical protein
LALQLGELEKLVAEERPTETVTYERTAGPAPKRVSGGMKLVFFRRFESHRLLRWFFFQAFAKKSSSSAWWMFFPREPDGHGRALGCR